MTSHSDPACRSRLAFNRGADMTSDLGLPTLARPPSQKMCRSSALSILTDSKNGTVTLTSKDGQ
jgi:hypothetical protein